MPSPFIGVDPFIEAQHFWQGFHASFIAVCQEILLQQLPPAYDAQIEERVYLTELSDEERQLFVSDVAIVREPGSSQSSRIRDAGVATLEPVTVPLALTYEVKERYIEILRQSDGEVVTIIELLSPSNKRNPDRGVYVQRRNALLNQPIHLVELDLLLSGERLPMRKPLPAGNFFALVSRAEARPNSEVYAWTVRDPLPAVPVPLKSPDGDIRLELGTVFHTAYDRGQYQRRIRYDHEAHLPLPREEQAWVASQTSGR